MDELPLSLNEVSPGQGATRLDPGTRWDGLPEGVHTGGCWLYQGQVWKPLDAKPYVNAECRVPTKEAEFLACMAENKVPLFPKNWEVVKSNGRRWLVRDEAYIFNTKDDYRHVPKDTIYQVEQSIRTVNALGWTINDAVVLAQDRDTYEFFIMDCSSAWDCQDKEDWRVMMFFREHYPGIATIRDAGGSALSRFHFHDEEYLQPLSWRWSINYVYASYSRPFWLSDVKRPPVDVDIWHTGQVNWDKGIPHSWIFSHEPIDQEYLDRYELKLCYFKWRIDK